MAAPQLQQSWPVFSRGATITITSNFFDAGGHPITVSGSSPQVNISYVNASTGATATTLVTMTLNSLGAWSANWDSRGAAPGVVYWSVETPGSPPVSVEDGQFTLEANQANQASF